MPIWASILFVFAGLFSIAGAILDWEWFMTSRRAAMFVRLLGRTGARIFYTLLGLFLVGVGAAGGLGCIP